MGPSQQPGNVPPEPHRPVNLLDEDRLDVAENLRRAPDEASQTDQKFIAITLLLLAVLVFFVVLAWRAVHTP